MQGTESKKVSGKKVEKLKILQSLSNFQMHKRTTLEVALEKKMANMILKYQDGADRENAWNLEEIFSFVIQVDQSLKRKPAKNIKRAIESAMQSLRNADSDSSLDSVPLDQVHDNSLNASLIAKYGKKQDQVVKKEKTDSMNEPKTKKFRKEKWSVPTSKLSDLGGIDAIIQEILHLIGMPLKHPHVYSFLGVQPPRGILLHGPPGVGKTVLANAIAGEFSIPLINISAPSIVSGMSGESEKKIREVFDDAKSAAPCILFIDEIDAITPKRETAQREMERRIVSQLLTCMDDLSSHSEPVIIIGATNRPDSLDAALRRAGRFDREISLGVPDETARARILKKLSQKLRLEGNFDFMNLAKMTPGFVGADLKALTSEAGMIAVHRVIESLLHTPSMDNDEMTLDDCNANSVLSTIRKEPLTEEELGSLFITQDDFLNAMAKVQPSAKREGFATVPGVSWSDIGALSKIRDELRMAVVEPIKHPEYFVSVGISAPMGVLLYGPPGCGKTLLAKAVANESHCNFISVKGPELLNKYVGESERAVRMVFARAAASSPCVIFFDELDALCPSRSSESESQSSSRLVNTLLTEMDGMQGRKQVYVIAATNRPDMIDPAMLRPGRLDKTLYVDLPNEQERLDILKTLSRRTPLDPDVDLQSIASDSRCEGYSGADLAALVRESAVTALRYTVYSQGITKHITAKDYKITVKQKHFIESFSKISASVGKRDRKRYELLKIKFGSSSADDQSKALK